MVLIGVAMMMRVRRWRRRVDVRVMVVSVVVGRRWDGGRVVRGVVVVRVVDWKRRACKRLGGGLVLVELRLLVTATEQLSLCAAHH